jgi:GAF domain-containing protein
VSIEVDGALAGVVCCEQTTLPRAWNAADHQYVKQVAAMCGLVAKKFGWR